MRHRFSFNLGKYVTVFQAEVYILLRHVLLRKFNVPIGNGTFIFSPIVKLLSKRLTICKISSKLSWD